MSEPTDRRGVLKAIGALLAGASAALASVPVLGSVLTPMLRPKPDSGGYLFGCALKELIVGVPKRVELTSTIVDGWSRQVGVVGAAWLLKQADGNITALSTVCPHSGCSINQKADQAYGCPCHDSTFGLDGVASEGPSPRPMDPLEVSVRDDQVMVKYRRFKIGVKERQEV